MTYMPRESANYISDKSKSVFIENEGINHLSCEIIENLKNGKISINNFSQSEYHPKDNDPKAADWIFVMDTLNFCFWSQNNGPKWKVCGQTGYFALCAAIKRAITNGIPITDAKYYSKISKNELANILQGDEDSGEIPLLEERVDNLRNVGEVLIKKYNGTFLECIKACNNSAEKLLKLIVNDFECFRDEAEYFGQRVSFYKRAQILVGDIWACFKGQGYGAFPDINFITMFADYRVPQVLVHFGTMRYSNDLLNKLKSGKLLESGCNEEVEIRGCSIEVVERVVTEVKRLIKKDPSLNFKDSDCNSILIDHFLWDYRRQHVEELDTIPYHKTKTIYY